MSGISRLENVLESIQDVEFIPGAHLIKSSGEDAVQMSNDTARKYDLFPKKRGKVITVTDARGKKRKVKLTAAISMNGSLWAVDVLEEKEMMIFKGDNEEAEQGFSFKVHPADQWKLERLLKAKKIEFSVNKEELANGYMTVQIPNDYVFMDKVMDRRAMSKMMTEYGIRLLRNRDEDNGREVVKANEDAKSDYVADFIKRAKAKSPGQSSSTYLRWAEDNWKNIQKIKAKGEGNKSGARRVYDLMKEAGKDVKDLGKFAKDELDYYW